jgi:hypothetical protein
VTDRFGSVGAIFMIAELADLIRPLLDRAVIAAGQDDEEGEEWKPSEGRHIPTG